MKKYGLEDFYNFSNGVNVSNQDIQDWVKICEDEVKKSNLKKDSYQISSGNTMVVSFKFGNCINTIITKDYVAKITFLK